jgi:hypothetical protein
VLATVPMTAGVVATLDLPVIVFSCIVATIAIFAVGLPLTTRGLRPACGAAAPQAPATEPVAAAAAGDTLAVQDSSAAPEGDVR